MRSHTVLPRSIDYRSDSRNLKSAIKNYTSLTNSSSCQSKSATWVMASNSFATLDKGSFIVCTRALNIRQFPVKSGNSPFLIGLLTVETEMIVEKRFENLTNPAVVDPVFLDQVFGGPFDGGLARFPAPLGLVQTTD